MDAQLKAKWVEALRSGEYRQGTMYLRREGKHCCLGVLCELAGLEISDGGTMVVGPHDADDYEPIYNLVGGSEVARDLWQKNDGNLSVHHSFAEIADYIEKTL